MARARHSVFKNILSKQKSKFKPILVIQILAFRGMKNRLRTKIRQKIVPLIVNQRSKCGIYAIDISNTNGLGAKLEWVLEMLAFCDQKNLQPAFRFSYPNERNVDYFSPYFNINQTYRRKNFEFTRIESMLELGWKKNIDSDLNFQYAKFLIDKYLKINPEILKEVDDFCQKNFIERKVLGLHYRGTDKSGEAPPVSYDKVLKNVRHYLELYPETGALFLSTDDLNFELFFLENLLKIPIIRRENLCRPTEDTAIHLTKGLSKHDVNYDALVNCLILSRCTALMKTSSFLSDWSKLFNLQMPVIMLNRPYERTLWFPARQILKETLYEPI